jgi:hypothetical protein
MLYSKVVYKHYKNLSDNAVLLKTENTIMFHSFIKSVLKNFGKRYATFFLFQ